MKDDKNGLVMVYKGSLMEAYIVRSMIGSEGILAFLNDELMSIIIPGYIETKVLVPAADAEKALQIVERYKHPDERPGDDEPVSS